MCKNLENYVNELRIQANYEGVVKLICLIGLVDKSSYEQFIFSFKFNLIFIYKKKLFSTHPYNMTFSHFPIKYTLGKNTIQEKFNLRSTVIL